MKDRPSIDVFFGESPERDNPELVLSINEGKKVMRQKRKAGYEGIVMYVRYTDKPNAQRVDYFFNKEGKIIKDSYYDN